MASFPLDDLTPDEQRRTDARFVVAAVRLGCTRRSVLRAVKSKDLSLLRHSGLFSVRLRPEGRP